jgi:hypothetical protein
MLGAIAAIQLAEKRIYPCAKCVLLNCRSKHHQWGVSGDYKRQRGDIQIPVFAGVDDALLARVVCSCIDVGMSDLTEHQWP